MPSTEMGHKVSFTLWSLPCCAAVGLFACFDTQVTPPSSLRTAGSSLAHSPTPLFSWQYFVARSAPMTGLHPLVTAMAAVHATFPLLRTASCAITLRHAGRPSDGSPPLSHHNGDTTCHFFASLGSTGPFVGNTPTRITV